MSNYRTMMILEELANTSGCTADERLALNKARSALRKEIAQEPLTINGHFFCDLCGVEVKRNHIYCHYCGQKTRWNYIVVDSEKLVGKSAGRNMGNSEKLPDGGKE